MAKQYSETELNALEQAASKEGRTARPATIKNGRLYLTMPVETRSYKLVAEKLGITDGRAAVYVWEYLTFIDKLDEAPARGRRSNGSAQRQAMATGNILLDNTLAQREQMLSEQDRIATAVNDANESAKMFDADEYMAEVLAELNEQRAEIDARIKAWTENTDDVATDSAKLFKDDLDKRAEKLSTESADVLANLEKQLSLANAAVKMIVGMDEDAANSLKLVHPDLAAEFIEGFEPPSEPAESNGEPPANVAPEGSTTE